MAKDRTEKVAPKKADTAAALKQTAEDRAQPGGEEGFIPNYHGYTPEQIELMEQARYLDNEVPAPQSKAWGADEDTSTDPADPDDLEDEIEQAEEEGEFKATHAKPKTKTKR
jgi:hypothetical protein